MDQSKTSFLPFHAINEYMLPEFRQHFISTVWQNLPALPKDKYLLFEKLARKYMQITGFRNCMQAPVPLKTRALSAAFQKHADLVAATLEAWSEIKKDLKERIYALLTQRTWEVLPVETDRTKIPGFFLDWNPNETFDSLYSAYIEMYPDHPETNNDVSLMVVWVSLRLPYTPDKEDDPSS